MPDIRFFNTYEPVSPFLRDLLPLLAKKGISSEVVLSSLEYRQAREPLETSFRSRSTRVRRIRAGKGVVKGRLKKLWAMTTYVCGAAGLSLFGKRANMNFFLTQPPIFSAWGLILRMLRNQPYCCLVMDIYPDVAVSDGLLKHDGLPARLLKAASRGVLRRANAVIVIGRCMRERMILDGISPARVHLVTNWVNDKEVQPVSPEKNHLRRQLGLDHKFVILYSGNMGVSHFFEDILEAARRLRHLPDLVFLFIGDGSRRPEVTEWQKRFDLQNIKSLPFQSAKRLSESLSLGDLHFISLRSGFEGLVVPSKAYGALAVGRPIVYQGNSTGEIARMVAEEGVGSVVPLNDPDNLSLVIERYYKDQTLAVDQGQRALALNGDKYSSKVAVSEYLKLLKALLKNDIKHAS